MTFRTASRIGLAAAVLAALTILTFRWIDISRDLSFFQPGALTETSKIAMEQVRSGPASRLILIAIEGAPQPELATLPAASLQSVFVQGF